MLRQCLPLFYAFAFIDYTSMVRMWRRRRSLRRSLEDWENTEDFVARDGLLDSHLTRELEDGLRPFRRRLRSQGFNKVMAVVKSLHQADYSGLGDSAAKLLKVIKGIKHIKGMGILLVRQCILHGLVKDANLGKDTFGKGQGLSLFWADFQLGPVTYDMMPAIVSEVQKWAALFWSGFKGKGTHESCNKMMQRTLLHKQVLSALDADALGCEGRRIISYFMGLPWKFGKFSSQDLPAPSIFDFLDYYPNDEDSDVNAVKRELGLEKISSSGEYVVLPCVAANEQWGAAKCRKM